ncbi:MAG TPA: cellulase family glycosylhydrolase, partial [Chryseosolibacter sp.]|nr:cellulase family glycosylhydrolase [Chryseosolibacter sp.]
MHYRIRKRVVALCRSTGRYFQQTLAQLILTFLLFSFGDDAFAQTFLRANGSKIVDASNNEVVLRGMGLGGWLLMEGYMLQVDGGYGQWQIKRDMKLNGATESEIENFFTGWRANHTTSADVAYLKTLGLNCVRLPMHYDLFLTTAQRAVRNDVIYGKIPVTNYVQALETWYDQDLLFNDAGVDGFATIDQTLQWAGANGMWVILDLHAAPGGQGSQSNINDALVGLDLWNRTDSKGRKIYQLITERLWKSISSRYKTDGRVAMYDLVNEPHGGVQNSAIKALYDKIIGTIRSNGDTHLILLEGNGYGNEYTGITPDLFPGQTNLVWNGHRYWVTNDPTVKDRNANQLNLIANLVNFRAKWNVPVWVGETGENSNHWVAEACKNLNDRSIGWCLWTHKRLHGSSSVQAQTASPMKVRYANIYTAAGRTALLSNILHSNCIKQKDYEDAMTRMVNDPAPLPFLGSPITIPGKIFASDFDIGRNGVSYVDAVYEKIPYNGQDWNFGHTYRNDGVDIEPTADATGNGVNVGWLEYNDWMNYSVNVTQSGSYTVQMRVSNGGTRAGGLTLKIDGVTAGTISVAPTGGWQNWNTLTLSQAVSLSAGAHKIQVLVSSRAGGGNLSWISFATAGSAQSRIDTSPAEDELEIAPNPVKDRIRIGPLANISTVRVYDVSGREVLKF